MAEERFSDLAGIIAESSGTEWHVIHAGQELGPFSLGELVEQAVIGRIGPDDLVKQTAGLWTKARDVGPLQEQFRLTQTKQETLDRIGRFHGIWISKKNLVAGGCILLLLVGWYGLNRLNRPDAQANSQRASAWLVKQEYDKAIKELDEAIRLEPNAPIRYLERGEVWLEKKDYDNAIKDFDEALRLHKAIPLDPMFVKLLYSDRNRIWIQKKDYDRAIKDCDEAIRLWPADPNFLFSRGFVWHEKKDYDKAIMDYDEAIRINPKDILAFRNRGLAWHSKQDNDKAIRDYDEAIRLDPKSSHGYLGRGRVWLAKKEHEQAIKDYDEAIRLDPKNESAYSNRGQVWNILKVYDLAIKDYDEAIRINPKNALAYYDRGDAWSAIKEYDKAMADYRIARRIKGYPEVRMSMRSDDFGLLRGTVHNETGKTIENFGLSIKTARWERDYEVKVFVQSNTTATFSVFVGDASLDVERFMVLDKKE
jgi:tetratricopeptide (TPR) repeat protein